MFVDKSSKRKKKQTKKANKLHVGYNFFDGNQHSLARQNHWFIEKVANLAENLADVNNVRNGHTSDRT